MRLSRFGMALIAGCLFMAPLQGYAANAMKFEDIPPPPSQEELKSIKKEKKADDGEKSALPMDIRFEAVREGAARDGLRVGDVVLAVGNTAVSSVTQFNAISAQLPVGKQVAVLVRRGESGLYVLIRPQN